MSFLEEIAGLFKLLGLLLIAGFIAYCFAVGDRPDDNHSGVRERWHTSDRYGRL